MVEDLDIVGVDVGHVSGSELVVSLLENMLNGKRIFTPLGDMLSSTCDSVTFKTNVAMVTCRKIEGRFPDFKRIIREESPIMVRVDKAEILDSVSRVCLVADSTQRLVKLSVKGDGQIVMTGCDLGFNKSGEETLVCESASGGDLTIGVKGLSFHQCLGSIESDYVNIGLEDAKKSIVMTCDNNPRRRVVLMPVMIG